MLFQTLLPRGLTAATKTTARRTLSSFREVPKRARVVVVGSGRMGHIRSSLLYANPRFEIAGIVDINHDGAANLANIYGVSALLICVSECMHRSDEERVVGVVFVCVYVCMPVCVCVCPIIGIVAVVALLHAPFRYSLCLCHVFCTNTHTHTQTHPYVELEHAIEDNHLEGIDGLIVSSPTFTHDQVIRTAANHGISVFTEKPVDETADKIKSLFTLAEDANIELCCGFQRRFDASYVAASSAVHTGQVGNPVSANIFFADHPCPPKEFLLKGGNIFMDLSAHDVDYIMHALNDVVVSVYATGSSSTDELEAAGVHDNATMVLKFSQGEFCGCCVFFMLLPLSTQTWRVYGVCASVHIVSRILLVPFSPLHSSCTHSLTHSLTYLPAYLLVCDRHGRDVVHEPLGNLWIRPTLRDLWRPRHGDGREPTRPQHHVGQQ